MVSAVYVIVIIDGFWICCETGKFSPPEFLQEFYKAWIFFNLQQSWGLIEQWEVDSTNANACLPTLPSVVMQEFYALFLHTTFHNNGRGKG